MAGAELEIWVVLDEGQEENKWQDRSLEAIARVGAKLGITVFGASTQVYQN